jgi:hypothetical protein
MYDIRIIQQRTQTFKIKIKKNLFCNCVSFNSYDVEFKDRHTGSQL